MAVLSGINFKAKYGAQFYKVLAKDLKHFDLTYKLGSNKDHNIFNPSGRCQKGGLYFTILKDITTQ